MKALIVVDIQKDFCPGGSLAVKDGDLIVPIINQLSKSKFFDLVVFTKDWHPSNMKAFASQHEGKNPFETYVNDNGDVDVLWPDHCVQDTPGAEFHQDIDLNIPRFYIFKKGTEIDSHPYSGFGDVKHDKQSGLLEFLIKENITENYIVGLALDYCVKDTAIDSKLAGFDTTLIMDGTKSISDDGEKSTINKFIDLSIKMIQSSDILYR
jgi:nicotinamidase/pyrazinamidase